MAGKGTNFGSFIRLPDLDRSTGISNGDFLIIRMDRHRRDWSCLFRIGFDQHPVVDIKQSGDLVFAAGNNSSCIVLEAEGSHRPAMSIQISQRLLIGIVPQTAGLVGRSCRHHRVVRTDSNGEDRLFVSTGRLGRRSQIRPTFDESVCTGCHHPGIA